MYLHPKNLSTFLLKLFHTLINMEVIDIKKMREEVNLSQGELSQLTGIPQGRIAKWETRGSTPKVDDYNKVLEAIKQKKEVVSTFLLNENQVVEELPTKTYTQRRLLKKMGDNNLNNPLLKKEGIPIYDIPIDASFLERYRDDGPDYEPIGFLNIPKLRNCDFGALISGNSMYPLMKSGSIAACRIITNMDYFDEGEMYFVSTSNGFETVKYVQSGEKPDELKLIPHNEKIKATTIKKEMVLRMCIVEAWINFR